MSNRRRRNHEATIEEIKGVARQVLAEQGSAGLNLSAIARRLDIVPSGLYRYFKSRDDLLATLAAEAYARLADTLEAAVHEDRDTAPIPDPVAGLRAAARAWRNWALAHPADFALIFGAPAPALYTDAVLAAAQRSGAVFARLIAEAAAGRATPPQPAVTLADVPPALHATLQSTTGSPITGALVFSGRIRLQGHLTAELFGHLPDVNPALHATLYELTIDLLLREAGLI